MISWVHCRYQKCFLGGTTPSMLFNDKWCRQMPWAVVQASWVFLPGTVTMPHPDGSEILPISLYHHLTRAFLPLQVAPDFWTIKQNLPSPLITLEPYWKTTMWLDSSFFSYSNHQLAKRTRKPSPLKKSQVKWPRSNFPSPKRGVELRYIWFKRRVKPRRERCVI